MRCTANTMKPALEIDLDGILERTPNLWHSFRGSRLFITGGTGFVGSWLVESILWANDKFDLGIHIVVLTRSAHTFAAREPWIAQHRAVRLLRGDARTFAFPDGDFDFVVHAASSSYAVPDSEVLNAFDADVQGTRRVLEFARKASVARMLFTSSGAVYGPQPDDLPYISERYRGSPSTTDPHAAYGQAKRVSEFLCTTYSHQYGFAATIARLFAFVGPRLPLDANYAVGNFIRDAIEGGPIQVLGDGTPLRSYLYAGDLAVWLWTILLNGEPGTLYNVGSGESISVAELANLVVQVTRVNTSVQIARKPVTGMTPPRYIPSVKRAECGLGLRATVSLGEGIRRTYGWALKQRDALTFVERQ